jgi:hypothetical protein
MSTATLRPAGVNRECRHLFNAATNTRRPAELSEQSDRGFIRHEKLSRTTQTVPAAVKRASMAKKDRRLGEGSVDVVRRIQDVEPTEGRAYFMIRVLFWFGTVTVIAWVAFSAYAAIALS